MNQPLGVALISNFSQFFSIRFHCFFRNVFFRFGFSLSFSLFLSSFLQLFLSTFLSLSFSFSLTDLVCHENLLVSILLECFPITFFSTGSNSERERERERNKKKKKERGRKVVTFTLSKVNSTEQKSMKIEKRFFPRTLSLFLLHPSSHSLSLSILPQSNPLLQRRERNRSSC